jgi:hypothetical protein
MACGIRPALEDMPEAAKGGAASSEFSKCCEARGTRKVVKSYATGQVMESETMIRPAFVLPLHRRRYLPRHA